MAVIKRRNNMIPPQPMIKEVVEDELESIKQGIVTILRSDSQSPDKSSSSIRRTLSADMSSKKWLAQNGFLTQTTAKNNFQHSSPYEAGEKTVKSNPGQDDVWRSIQSQKKTKESNPIWCSILTNQKDCNDHKSHPTPLPPPYVPAKRSSSTLSEKSLEICTESLGSETGSDFFLSSSYSSDYSSCQDADDHQERENILTDREEAFKDSNSYENMRLVKYKNTPVRPFPPPIRSISTDGDSLHVQSRRENGRLVLEAVSVPPRNYFHAQREDGRLILTLIRHHKASSDQFASEENKKIDEETKEKGGIQEEEGDNKYEVAEQEVRSLLSPNSMIRRAHKTISPVMNSLTSPGKKNPTMISKEKVRDHHRQIQITQSLPSPRVSMMITQPTPPCTTASSFNAYEHFWRNKTTTMVAKRSGFTNPVIDNSKSMSLKNYKANDDHNIYVAKQYMNRDLVVTTTMMRGGKVESLVPYLKKGCKEPKRSLLIWEPYCIATS